jgi:hypothetical protein
MSTDTKIDRLRPLQQYQQDRAHIFPSLDSLRWAVRTNRTELESRGALVKIAERMLVDPARADQVFVAVGRRRAKTRR